MADTSPRPGPTPAGTTADDVLSHSLVIDGHNDLPWELREQFDGDLGRVDLLAGSPSTVTDLPRLAAGGVGAQFWSVYVPATLPSDRAVTTTFEQMDLVRRMAARYPDHLGLAWSADDVDAQIGAGRIASLMGVEGGHSIGGSLGVLRSLAALGMRYLTLTHNHNVPWADSATDVEVLGGLSPFGEEVVAELNRLGVLVDLSHVSPGTMRHALRVTRAPVIFSHSGARAVVDHPRNVPDDVLASLAANSGVCMVTFVPAFVSPTVAAWHDARREEALAAGIDVRDLAAVDRFLATIALSPPAATVQDVADHVDHVRDVAGIAHVGLGSDFDGTPEMPDGLSDVSGYPRLLHELASRGWSNADLSALTSGNILRVLRAAEDVADGSDGSDGSKSGRSGSEQSQSAGSTR